MKTRSGLFVTAAALVLFAGAPMAAAQFVTEPPKTAPKPEDHIPKDSPVAMPPASIAPAPMAEPAPPPLKGKPPIVLPDLPYPSLVKKDAEGKLIPLTEPADYAALKVNPMLKPEDIARIQDYLKERRHTFESILTENLDLAEKIDGGIFENIDMSVKTSYTDLLNVSKPLRTPSTPKPLPDELQERHLLSEQQAEFNRKIAKEYSIAASITKDPKRQLAILYKQGVTEAMSIYRQMELEVAQNLDKTLPTLELPKPDGAKAMAAAKDVKAAKTDDARLTALKKVNEALSLDQRKELIRKTLALRPK